MSEFFMKGGSAGKIERSKAEAEAKLRRDEVTRMEGEGPLHPDVFRKPVRRTKPAGPVKR